VSGLGCSTGRGADACCHDPFRQGRNLRSTTAGMTSYKIMVKRDGKASGPKPELQEWRKLREGYLPRIMSIPASSKASFWRGSLPTREVRKALSTVTIWDTLATESLGNPVSRAEN